MEFLKQRLGRTWFSGMFILSMVALACSPNETQDPPGDPCEDGGLEFMEMAQLDLFLDGGLHEFSEARYLEGYVTATGQGGNIFGSLYLQDRLESPTRGLEIKTDLLNAFTYFPEGSRVRILLSGLFLGRSGAGWALGSRRDIFGNPVLDRLPAQATLEHIVLSCEPGGEIAPLPVWADSLRESHLHTLIRIPDLEVVPEHPVPTFALEGEETLVPLVGCEGTGIELVNSGFSDFQAENLPEGSGTATGILVGRKGDFQLLLRRAEDLDLSGPTCEERFPPMRSDSILISELADPDNEAGARFLELYNAGKTSISLRGWKLQRYTNGNSSPGMEADLTGLEMEGGATLVFSANPGVFQAVYGFTPDVELRTNGPADSNGDDNILLVDPFGTVVDIFGIPGEDGSGTSHEFEDGRALRRAEVARASDVFQPSQWQVWNDTGASGTLHQPMLAPADFTPGQHPEPLQPE